MTPLKLIRKFGKLVRGGAGPTQIFLGCFLGVLVGMIPGMNLTLVLAILLLVIFNGNFGLAVLGIAAGKVLSLLVAPLTFQLGYTIIHGIGQEELFRTVSAAPVAAWLDLHVYCLVGGVPVALVAGFVFGWIVMRLIIGLRKRIVDSTTRSEKVDKLAQNKLVRLLLRILFGKQKKDLAEMADQKQPIIRMWAFVLAIVALVIAVGVELLALDYVLKRTVESSIGRMVGAEVNVGKAKLSLRDGKLLMEDIQITDPDKPTHNVIHIEKLEGNVSMRELLAKRFVIDKLELTGVEGDMPRKSPGKVYDLSAEERAKQAEQASQEQPEDAAARYIELGKDLRKYLRYVEKLKEYVKRQEAGKQKEGDRKQRTAALAGNRGYLSLSASELLTERPAWTIREIVAGKVKFNKDGKDHTIGARELSSNPRLNGKPMTFNVTGGSGFSAMLALDFTKDDGSHRVRMYLPNLLLGKMVGLSDAAPVSVEEGKAHVTLDGTFNAKSVHLPVTVTVVGMQANAREGRKVLGLSPETAAGIFKSLSRLTVVASIEGPIDAPRLKVDEKQTVENLKNALVKAGQLELLRRADRELLKLKSDLSEKVKDKLGDQIPSDLSDVLDKLIPGGKKKDKGPKSKNDKKLDDLLKLPF